MKNYKIIYENGYKEKIQSHEKHAAKILKEHFRSDIIFQKTINSKNPDFYVCKTGALWELKSPIGDGKRTIDNNLRNAKHQSVNIILDLSRCKMLDEKAISRIRNFLKRETHGIKKLKVILKSTEVLDIIK